MRIEFKRICDVPAPIDIVTETVVDWTHFMHLHRKSHLEFRLLHKEGRRETFLYKARLIYPLPFYRTFIVFREYLPEQRGYHQFYLHVKTGAVHYLNSVVEQGSNSALSTGIFSFDSSRFWKWFPWLFKKLFALRMRMVQKEDDVWIKGRIAVGGYNESACAPFNPEQFDLFDELLKKNLPTPEMRMQDTVRVRL